MTNNENINELETWRSQLNILKKKKGQTDEKNT